MSNSTHFAPRRIAAAVALALAAGTGSAWAAGLGRLTIQSALGQPLRAEVEITSLSREEAATLNARLASPDAFRQAGLEFNPALNSLRFAVERRQDGRSVVRITSAQPINEPFVDLLVELNWAAGRLVREYTFLLDPPELRIAGRDTVEGGNQQRSAVVPPSSPAAQAATPAPAPAAAAAAQPAAAAATPAAPVAAATPPAPSAPARAAGAGPIEVRAGDTLAGIASRVRPEGVSLDQTLIALYQTNPSAFFGGVHQLKAGAALSVPDAQTIASVDAAAARQQIRAHTRDFNEYRARLAERAAAVAAGRAGQTVEGSVTARVDDKAAPGAGGDQLRLSRPEAAAASPAGSATGTATSRTAAGAEREVARDAAVREAQSRVVELEKNVGDLQRLLELKNQQLADLQRQVDEARATGKVASGAIASAPAASAPAAGAAPAAAAATTAPSQPQAEPAAAPVAAPGAAQPAAQPAADTKPAPVAATRPAPTPGLFDELTSNPLVLPGLGAILALGAGYGWYAMRRRRKVETFEDSLIAAEGFATNSLFGSTGGQSVDTSSNAFTPSTRGADSGVDVHSTEVDPIAEAEVYIAYGREAQAEEILREALRRQPDRQAIRAKLLEIYSGRKDLAEFNALAGEMHEMTGGQNEEWPKVVTLGLALDPDNPLYTGRAPAARAAAVPQAEPGADRFFETAGEQPAQPFAQARPPVQAQEREQESAVDFGLLEGAAAKFADTRPLAEKEPMRKAAAEDDVPALDFDLDLDTTIGKAGGMIAAARETTDESATELERAVEGRFELPSLDLPAARTPEPVAKAAQPAADDDLNIDLPALEELTRTAAARAASGAAAAVDGRLSPLDLELEAGGAATAAESSRFDEMTTKLDLASAYEEIGDKEGARELLEEVIKGAEGDLQQKARSLLAKIG